MASFSGAAQRLNSSNSTRFSEALKTILSEYGLSAFTSPMERAAPFMSILAGGYEMS